MQTETIHAATATMIKMTFDRWNTQLDNFDKALNSFTDEQLKKEIAPGKNTGIYLLGHLIAVHDHMLPLIGISEKKYPELTKPFLELPDKSGADFPSAQALRELWKNQKAHLHEVFNQLTPEQWFKKHTAASDEDFVKEPHRNKLNIIVTRTSHLSYHLGQFILLK
ncbi:MAG TPA: DinB family protein [Flavobacteriales bacterium]|nr:DinB family protein [Flavobacteriales bacterium]